MSRSQPTRKRLLDAALKLILAERRGFTGVSLRQITDLAGLSAPAFYHHFSDTDELADALVDQCLDETMALFSSAWQQVNDDEDPIAACLRAFALQTSATPEPVLFLSYKLAFGAAKRRLRIRTRLAGYIEEYIRQLSYITPPFDELSESQARLLINMGVKAGLVHTRDIVDQSGEPMAWASTARSLEAELKILVNALRADCEHVERLSQQHQRTSHQQTGSFETATKAS